MLPGPEPPPAKSRQPKKHEREEVKVIKIKAAKQPEETLVKLLVLLFFVSFITSLRLLLITAVLVTIYCFFTCEYKDLYKFVRSVLPFMALLLLPAVIRFILAQDLADLDFTIMVSGKIFVSALCLGAVMSRHSALYLVEGVLKLGLPPLFNSILVLTFRYCHMVSADVQIGRKALAGRGIAERRGGSVISIFGEWIGGFFLKSISHSERVFKAMKARGFQGLPPTKGIKNKKILCEAGLLTIILIFVLLIDRTV
ncbi:MAG: energy-coupling factor transporter transmembrane protein EcfT [Firmicutes bacterium]|nr:energy-coupling factor transporter transmembrane protein EcfT [Bacillota bacterium]